MKPSLFGWPVSAWADLIQSAAIIVAGIWAYLLFIRGRQRYPRATLNHRATHRELGQRKVLLRLKTQISNPGVIVLRFTSARVQAEQILPLPENLKAVIDNHDPVEPDNREVEWPVVAHRASEWPQGDFEIEPGEADEVIWDFVVPDDLETIALYSYFRNVRKRRGEIGWSLTTLYDFKPQKGTQVVEGGTEDPVGEGALRMGTRQQRPKPSPRPGKQQPPKKPVPAQQPPKKPPPPQQPPKK